MKYGMVGGFIRLAFEKTATEYMQKAFPKMDMAVYRARGPKKSASRRGRTQNKARRKIVRIRF